MGIRHVFLPGAFQEGNPSGTWEGFQGWKVSRSIQRSHPNVVSLAELACLSGPQVRRTQNLPGALLLGGIGSLACHMRVVAVGRGVQGNTDLQDGEERGEEDTVLLASGRGNHSLGQKPQPGTCHGYSIGK